MADGDKPKLTGHDAHLYKEVFVSASSLVYLSFVLASLTAFCAHQKLYEDRKYKKALKSANKILAKHPEHGGTIAMKGLVLSSMGEKVEGAALIESGIAASPSDYITHHVQGIMFRAQRNYPRAIASYRKASELAPDNHQILKDLWPMLMQLRRYKELVRWFLLVSFVLCLVRARVCVRVRACVSVGSLMCGVY
jgi:tetratricopeptide (TPR) repeat protein